MGESDENDSTSALITSGKKSKNKNGKSGKLFVTFHRLVSLTLLGLIGGLYFYETMQLKNIRDELKSDEDRISTLKGVVQSQATIIDRFNASVTNSDVLAKMDVLQKDLNETRLNLLDQMAAQTSEVDAKLKTTMDELNEAVDRAEAQIHAEVDTVKRDVESYVISTNNQFSMENKFMKYQIAGTFTLIGCLISMWHMTSHLRKFNQPFVQRKILAILWMCPIYSVTSWLSLVFDPLEAYLTIIKDCYEAYVIYMFLSFLIAVLGRGNRTAVVNLLSSHADHLQPPVKLFGCCFPNAFDSAKDMADAVLLQCQVFGMQFVLFKPLTSVAEFALDKADYPGGGMSRYDYRNPRLYITIIENFSVFMAFYGLLKFYHAVVEDLNWCRPWPKFLCIKGVVFMTFWQGIVISLLATYGSFGDSDSSTQVSEDSTDKWSAQIQNFLICLEMLIFSIAHFYVFPTAEWVDGYRLEVNKDSKFGDNLALRDFMQDIKLLLGSKRKSVKRSSSSGKKLSEDATGTPIKDDEEEGLTNETQSCDTRGNTDDHESANGREQGHLDDDDHQSQSLSSSHVSQDSEKPLNHTIDIDDLQKTLETALTSPEMQAATARLLKGRILDELKKEQSLRISQDFVDGSAATSKLPEEQQDKTNFFSIKEKNSTLFENGNTDESNQPPSEEEGSFLFGSNTATPRVSMVEKSEEPGETTSLLESTAIQEEGDAASTKEDILQPSIFTSLAALKPRDI
mmetsp:Transcript_67/g.172  ORF Transcript_67/g.172 Transcript_67/m.172 type:complete len:739 (-) Transcript_67:57-2273(-)|eukprot:CAMPEP_0195525526 /NCGR_PEP_ID=MMETSP0794_2-20130614/25998_1 /TAXON_ID=515487 /ORGANISM="Stephanopyxis turris, Strain CCMP 815" /LENGTH=738 /DNA_ID=CAMNT_0040656005 /DNA_START=153 /DNA_END=2369 /DNA_ORIENTATION=+